MEANVNYEVVRTPTSITLTMTPEIAERLRGFLQSKHVGDYMDLWTYAYNPLRKATEEAGALDHDTANGF